MNLGKWVQELTLNAQGFVAGIMASVRQAQAAKAQINSSFAGVSAQGIQKMSATATGALQQFAGLDIAPGTAVIAQGISTVTSALAAVEPVVNSIGGPLAMVTLKIAAVTAALGAMSISTLKSMEDMGDLLERFNSDAFGLQALLRAGELEEIGADTMITSMSMLARRMGEAKKAMAAGRSSEFGNTLELMGLQAETFLNLPVEEAFRRYAIEVSKFADASDRAAMAQEGFGRGSQGIMELMTGGEELFRKAAEQTALFADTRTQGDIAAATVAVHAYNDAAFSITATFNAIKDSIALAFAPIVSFVSKAIYAVLALVQPVFDIFRDMARIVGEVLTVIGDMVLAAVEPFLVMGRAVMSGLKAIWAGIRSAIMAVLNPILGVMRGITKALNIIVVEALPLIGKVIRIIALAFEGLGKAIGAVFEWVGDVLGPIFRMIGFGIGLVVQWIGLLASFLEKIPGLSLIFKGWGKDLTAAGQAMRDAMKMDEITTSWGAFDRFTTRFRLYVDGLRAGMSPYAAGQEAQKQIEAMDASIENIRADGIRQLAAEFQAASWEAMNFRDVLTETVPTWQRFVTPDAADRVAADLIRQAQAQRDALRGTDAQRAAQNTNEQIDKRIRELREAIMDARSLRPEDVEFDRFTRQGGDPEKLREMLRLQTVRRSQELAASVQKMNEDLQFSLRTHGMINDEVAVQKLLQGVTNEEQRRELEATVEHTRELQRQLRIKQTIADLEKQGEAMAKSVQSPLDKYLEAVYEAQGLQIGGFIDDATYSRQLARLTEEFERSMAVNYQPPKAVLEGSSEAFSIIMAARREDAAEDPQRRMVRLMEEARQRDAQRLEFDRRTAEGIERALAAPVEIGE